MKMFNLINIGERVGSGMPNIFNVWTDEVWKELVIEERFDPDGTILSLSFLKKRRYQNERRCELHSKNERSFKTERL